ncbi:MAG: copper-binding protein [Bacteroidota bacterium]
MSRVLCVACVLSVAGLVAACASGPQRIEHPVEGRVLEFRGTHGVLMQHGDIPGVMGPMETMAFTARDSTELEAVSVGDSVHFVWVFEGQFNWIEGVEHIAE